jgi:ABC-type transport system involved in cytochrome c biogenesis permease subunit
MMRTAAALFLSLIAAAAGAAERDPLAALRELPVQDGGRVKPLDTFARETARRVTGARAFGGDSVAGRGAVEWIVGLWSQPERGRAERIVRVADASLRAHAGLPADRERFSFEEIAGSEPFLAAAAEAQEAQEAGESLTADQDGLVRLYANLSLMAAVMAGDAPRLAPLHGADSWLSPRELGADGAPRRAFEALLSAHRAGGRDAVEEAAWGLRTAIAAAQPPGTSDAAAIEREVRYNRWKPFRAAWILYLGALIALASALSLRRQALSTAGLVLLTAGFAVQTYGFYLRTLIAGRSPVANMYETIVFASWGAVLLALVYEARLGTRLFGACASGLSVLLLLVADGVPIFDAAIDPLAPVLRDNFWLSTHVLTITLGYAALFLALALGHVSLGLLFFRRGEAQVRTVSGFIYRSMQAGTLLLAAGTLLGGVWASYSWGRFWGWDPKETWALIALLVYLAILHARFAGWLKDLGLAVGSVIGGLSVVMAWYGVNYVLGTGLHSYGFGSGGVNGWVFAFAALELGLAAATAWRVRAPRMAGGAALAHS